MSRSTTPATTSTSPISSSSGGPADTAFAWAFTDRSGGISEGPYASLNLADYVGDAALAVALNRHRAAVRIGLTGADLAVMSAVHGADVAVVDRAGRVEGVDALVTQTAGMGLVALGADCVTVALLGSDGVTCGVAHCGWRGLARDVVGATVGVIRDLGTDVAQALCGPSICGHCYPVPVARANEVRDAVSETVSAQALVVTADGQPGIDVRSGVAARLAELGIESVSRVGGCTAEESNLFSHRRDSVTGRQGVLLRRTMGE